MSRTTARLVRGRYQLERRIADGGMSHVWAGRDTRLSRPVAVKFLRQDVGERRSVRERFEGEARAAAGLMHPNVVHVYDSGSDDGIPYLVMELLPGSTLADELADGPLSLGRVHALAGEILAALAAAHAHGVIHRDVKPGNVLLTEEGTAKVADFGIAKTADAAATQTGEVLGTVAYMAPERFQGEAATPLSDLYSVGAVLYEALTGTVPFGENPWAVADAIRQGRRRPVRELRPDADRALADAVERALAPDPGHRFASAEEMAAAIREEARPTGTTEPVVAPTRALAPEETGIRGRRLSPVAVAVAGLVLAVAVVVGMLLQEPSPRERGGPPAAETTELPAPLEDALRRLEEAVRP